MKNLYPKTQKKNNFFNDVQQTASTKEGQIFSAEVLDIILDDTHPDYLEFSNIGTVKFRTVDGPRGYAVPLSPYLKKYPLIHETVVILKAHGTKSGIASKAEIFYYFDIINIWSLTNYNPAPFSVRQESDGHPSAVNKYKSPVGKKTPTNQDIEFGEYFEERPFIPDVQPFEGDVILQGRWGNSIRLGTTVKEKTNIWSQQGEDGDPIMILRNHNYKQKETEFSLEDINEDGTSMYLCDGQLIPLKIAYPNHKSYGTNKIKEPVKINEYFGKQVLISTDRLTFNAKNDSIFLSAKESVNISSEGTINFDSKKPFIAESKEFYFGVNAEEHGVLGDTAVDLLKKILQEIQKLTVPTPAGPSGVPINSPAFLKIQQELKTMLSKKFFIE